MSPPPKTETDSLRRNVRTDKDNTVSVKPFEVYNLRCPATWDPSKERLKVEYDVKDVNSRALSGRILYLVPGNQDVEASSPSAAPVVVHKQALTQDQIKHGPHTLQQWDGTISEGLSNRKGKKVTGDLSPISVRVEIWNKNTPAPGRETGDGRTDVPGEYLSKDITEVQIDILVEAKWDNDRCIPYDDPEEPDLGWTKMKVKVRNIVEGTKVRIRVCRIGNIEGPESDALYARTGEKPDAQPGLQGATVQGDRVLLKDGKEPYVRFNNYDLHWEEEGNNFYCFYLAFGERGKWMVASQRDYMNKENECLHMRFTVFIHRPADDLPDYTTYADRLHQFFRGKTKYYRSYLLRGPAQSMDDWVKYFQHRYIVIFLGHAACACRHPGHPKKGKKTDDPFLDPYHSGFTPDLNWCPPGIEDTKLAKAQLKGDKETYKRKFAGCRQKSHVSHQMIVGKVPGSKNKIYFVNWFGRTQRDLLLLFVGGGATKKLPPAKTGPRLYFFSGGCRSILTTNFGEYFTKNQTRYYSGWTYSPRCDFGRFCYDVFTRFIKGTSKSPAKTEFETGRLVPAFVAAASRQNRAKFHARITDRSSSLSSRGPVYQEDTADQGESALA